MIIARDNGNLEIYQLNNIDPLNKEPELKYMTCLDESITSLASGCVVSTEVPDILITTYSGKVIGLADPAQARSQPGKVKKIKKGKRV